MSYTLEITFEGLCAFLPSEPIGARPLDWMTVLMVETASPDKVLKPHRAIIEFNREDEAGAGAGLPGGIQGAWTLREEDVFLTFDPPLSGGGVSVITGRRPRDQERPRPEFPNDEEDFSWVPSLAEALPTAEAERVFGLPINAGNVKNDCISPNPAQLVARFHFNRGTLSVQSLVKVFDKVAVLQFVPSGHPSPLRQALASKVVLRVDGVTGTVRLSSRKFGNGSPGQIVLGSADRKNSLRVLVKHLCCSDPQSEQQDARDHDFEWYYRLSLPSKGKVLPAPLPVRYEVPGNVGDRNPGGGEFKRCGDGQVNALQGERKARYETFLNSRVPDWTTSRNAELSKRNLTELEGQILERPRLFRRLRGLVFPLDNVRVQDPLDKFEIEKQKGDYWCWASVAVSVAKFFGHAVEQCSLAKDTFVHVESCCVNDRAVPDCDNTQDLRKALERVGQFVEHEAALTFEEAIRREFPAGRPIVCKMDDWVTSRRREIDVHAIVVRKLVDIDGDLFVDTLDPWDQHADRRSLQDFSVRNLSEFYLTKGAQQ